MSTPTVEPPSEPTTPKCPEPGLYRGVSFPEYWSWGAINHSLLEPFSVCPAKARYLMLHPEETEALDFGHALHTAILEPERFEMEYITAPADAPARRSNVDKAWWKSFEDSVQGKTILKASEKEKLRSMQKSIDAHQTAAELLHSSGMQEVSIVWKDEQTGVLCKARIDKVAILASWTFVCDLKSTIDASEKGFPRSIARYHYHQQAAMYVDGLNTLSPRPRRFAFIAVEKDPPFLCAVHELEEGALEQGRREYRHHLEQFKRCEESGIWPGYPQGLTLVSLPPWAQDGTMLSERS